MSALCYLAAVITCIVALFGATYGNLSEVGMLTLGLALVAAGLLLGATPAFPRAPRG